MKLQVERIIRLVDDDGATLIEAEILNGGVGIFTHSTTNLTMDQLDAFIAAIKQEAN